MLIRHFAKIKHTMSVEHVARSVRVCVLRPSAMQSIHGNV